MGESKKRAVLRLNKRNKNKKKIKMLNKYRTLITSLPLKEHGFITKREIWEKYEDILTAEQALDFDDLLAKTLRLLENNRSVRETLHGLFSNINNDNNITTQRIKEHHKMNRR